MLTLAMCTIFHNEAEYLAEWVELHRIAGVEHFFLYDNLSEDDPAGVLAPYVDEGLVTLVDWPLHPRGQMPAYTHCVTELGPLARWIAFVDADEFFFAPGGGDLKEALEPYDPYGGVAVNYVNFGTSGHKRKPAGLVAESYVRRADHERALIMPAGLRAPHLDPTVESSYYPLNARVSSVVQPARVVRCLSPHFFEYRPGFCAVTENHEPVFGPMTDRVSVERLRMNHYWTKSEEECHAKFTRGRADTGVSRAWPDEFLHRDAALNAVYDDEIHVHLPALRAALERVSAPARA
jgi:hypothetical protein